MAETVLMKKFKVSDDFTRGAQAWSRFVDRAGGYGCIARKFPGEGKREVRVNIHNFQGNPHYHVEITEEDNPVWDDERSDWWSTFHDSAGRGARFSCKFFKLANAEKFVKLIWDDWFKPGTHKLVDSSGMLPKASALQKKFRVWSEKSGD